MRSDDDPPDPAALVAEVARLTALLADREARARAAHEDMLVRIETLESHRHSLERMVDAYADLYDFAPIPYLALDSAGLIRDINLTATVMLQVERHRLLGRPLRLHVALADRPVFFDHMLGCRRTHAQVACELRLQAADGREIPVQLISRRAAAGDDGLTYRTMIVDLSERRHAEAALHRGHQRLELAIAASGGGLFESTWPAGELEVAGRWAQILGRELADLPTGPELDLWWRAQIDPDQRGEHDAAFAMFLAGGVATHTAEFRVRHASGDWLWVRELAQVAERDPAGRARRVVGVMVDITVEKTRLTEARERTAQLQSLAAALFRVEENERRELATLLHDDLGQRMVAIKLKLAALDREALQPVVGLLDETHATIRSLAFQLSPPILRDLGLLAGLRWLAREFTARYDLPVAVDEDGPVPPLVGDPAFLLFRCVRELLFNTVKHARATGARVLVATGDPHAVHIFVDDDGAGFDPASMTASRSFGLLNVRERLGWLGGEMQVDSAPGRGTRVCLVVPRVSALVGDDRHGREDE